MTRSSNRNARNHRHDNASCLSVIRHSSFVIRHSPTGATGSVPGQGATGSASARRGVLLLVVLGLLTIFTLLAVTFVIVARQSAIGSRGAAQAEQREDPPQVLLNAALMQVIRGSDNRRSVIGPHSIKEDMNGSDGEMYLVQPFIDSSFASGQFLTFNLAELNGVPQGPPAQLETNVDNYYNGRVATFLDGPAAGQSARVVGYDASSLRIQVMALENGTVPNGGDRVLINGRPFNGTGFGYDPATFAGNQLVNFPQPPGGPIDPTIWEYALLPNPVFFERSGQYIDPAGLGGADEDYDIPDFQNMILAMLVSQGPDPITGLPRDPVVPIPSLHRPALINYWIHDDRNGPPAGSFAALPADLKRKIMLRPNTADHPQFTGSNFLFDPVNGPWDIDNNGDGLPDSVWVDLGFPVQTADDGRQYKPLAAILVLDLDGRLNLNAHGGPVDLAIDPNFDPIDQDLDSFDRFRGPYAGQDPEVRLPRGLGFGPAEISLMPVFNNDVLAIQALIQGGAVEGRYGEAGVTATGLAQPGKTGGGGLITVRDELLSKIKHWGMPSDYWNFNGSPPTAWGSPPDMYGFASVGLDLRGQPLYNGAVGNQIWDHPYQIDLSRTAVRGWSESGAPGQTFNVDAPFTPRELEPLLRPYDLDISTLESRLQELVPSLVGNPDRRHLVTVDSWDPPVPGGALPSDVANVDDDPAGIPDIPIGGQTLVTVLRERLVRSGLTPSQIQQNMRDLLSPDLIAGLRFDINRPFGNGYDDHINQPGVPGYTVVDEPGEAPLDRAWNHAGTQTALATPNGGAFGAPFDHNNDGAIDPADERVRQHYARHLYVLMMLLSRKDPNVTPDAHARRTAQWAVNVVDFRDRDSIMTAFEFDIEPFDDSDGDGLTWDVDGTIGEGSTDDMLLIRGVVWGIERPELLITETLALHDRRTDDRPNDDGVGTTTDDLDGDGMPDDPDFDQENVPQGSLFVELYNPLGTSQPPAAETNENHPLDGQSGVALQKRTPTMNHPIWRLAITLDPRPPEAQDNIPIADRIERTVYFADATAINDGSMQKHWSDNRPAGTEPVVRPGHYAVIGPKLTSVGRLFPGPKRIELSDARASVYDPSTGLDIPPYDAIDSQIKPFEYITMDRPPLLTNPPMSLRLSVSEPYDWYPDPGLAGRYDPPQDKPIDAQRSINGTDPFWGGLWNEGTTPDNIQSFRTIHLQRLANPLLDWNPEPNWPGHQPMLPVNPYITVDSMPTDLVVYNSSGLDDDPSMQPAANLDMAFDSRQRAGALNNVWVQESRYPTSGTRENPIPNQSLGYLNPAYQTGWLASRLDTLYSNPMWTKRYVGDPNTLTFPWLTWNNRPFASVYEAMLVPDKAPWELLAEGSFALTEAAEDQYEALDPASTDPVTFNHLLNFFESKEKIIGPIPGAQWHRFFEYAHVPSRFVGTETVLDPNVFYADNLADPLKAFHPYYAPFNKVSRYRDPGRVNINTIFDRRVAQGVVDRIPAFSLPSNLPTFWGDFTKSRRGFELTSGTAYGPADSGLVLNNDYPTFFANPFRSGAGSDLVPIQKLKDILPREGPPPPAMADPRLEIDVTLLRRDPNDPMEPLFAVKSGQIYENADRNPYFRYQAYTKLGNLVTNRSNVYAIWVTVGYFEVTPGPVDAGHPDGYRLGRELGVDTGEIERHRAFAIFDRTIPVAFERGKNHNVDKAILVKRFIE